MPTFDEALSALEAQQFVGRARELALFQDWLAADTPAPELLNVTGRGGIGKSALLRAFARLARQLGKPVVLLDSRDFPHTLEGLLRALGSPGGGDPVATLNRMRPLMLLDTFEELGALRRYLQDELLPRLDAGVKLVIAGRFPFGQEGRADSRWQRLVRPLPLEGLSADESREYLRRRGLLDPALGEQVVRAAGGNPLALVLAADLAMQLGSRGFAAAGEWRLVVRSLVERLLDDVHEPVLRELLDACAVVRQFDEDALAALTDRDEVGAAFAELCRLSMVRPAEHGLALHDDVRRALADDLRWRRPERYRALRLRALGHYRERARAAPPAEREWLLAERLFLCENALLQTMMFQEGEPAEVWLEPGRPDDHADVLRILTYWLEHYAGPEMGVQFDDFSHQGALAHLAAVLTYRDVRLRIAHGRDGQALGFSLVLPVCQESLPLIADNPVLGSLVQAYWRPTELVELPRTADRTDTYYLMHLVHTDVLLRAVQAALLRDIFGLFALGGRYLSTLPRPRQRPGHEPGFWAAMHQMFAMCGFELVEGAHTEVWAPADGYALDLTRMGVDVWLEAIASGRRPTPGLPLAELERELLDVLTHWHDDARPAQSPLLQQPTVAAAADGLPGPQALRQAVSAALARARAEATTQQELGYRALELAYLQKTGSHERAAERLGVSPATFYRLLKRGVQGLASALAAD